MFRWVDAIDIVVKIGKFIVRGEKYFFVIEHKYQILMNNFHSVISIKNYKLHHLVVYISMI